MYKKNLIGVLLIGLATGHIFSQGNDNPTGVAGEFNGSVTTGCHYDPYTGNAKRSVTDLVVAGGIGTYPLEFTRISNSREQVFADNSDGGQSADLGVAGAWLHSYQWTIDSKLQANGARPPSKATVNYPDGRVVTFYPSTNGDPYYRGLQGVRDRLQFVWDSNTAGRAYLIMPDGGKVLFGITISPQSGCGGSCKLYSYKVQSVIDPYGQTTTITGSPQSLLVTVTEPGGRWIKMFYINSATSGYLIDHITASDGRTVQYTYIDIPGDLELIQVNYFNDPTLVATYTYQPDSTTGTGPPVILSTCIDPMYSGPMWKIGYRYASGAYGYISSENYFDGTNIGSAVSTLSGYTETRGDGKTRTFTYGTPPFLTSWTDFKGHPGSQTYDSNKYVNAVTDFNGHTTNFTNNAFTGGRLTTTFPSTPGDTPPNTPRGIVSYTYGSASCADPNNRDFNNPYYVCTATDEGGHVTSYMRDTAKRITQINYPDGGSESLHYNSFGQVTSHTLRTGGIETFEYDTRGLRQKYRDPYHASGNPSMWYQYDGLDRVSGITDALGTSSGDVNHTTSSTYNSRGQLLTTTHPVDPGPNNGGSTDAQAGQRYTITNSYNPNGTLASRTDEENHPTTFTYDDYRRLRTVTTPGHNTPLTASVFYDANGSGDDYTHTDSNPTWFVSPNVQSPKKIKNTYDENYRKLTTTAAFGTSDTATTSYGYDNVGNVTSVIAPNEQSGQIYSGSSTTIGYDERNRLMSIVDAQNASTTFKYDAGGRRASVSRQPSGQLTTYDSYDAMNRLLQQTVKQTPDPDAVTKYSYYTSGFLHTMQDPRLVANNSSEAYTYQYDSMGRKASLTYPRPTPSATPASESWHYDTAGRNDTFTNRATNVETFTYDAFNRLINSSWNDGLTPSVSYGYDVASRMTKSVNANATIARTYFNDNLLNSETSTYADSTPRSVTYTYDSDYNRGTIQYPNGAYSFTYNYTGRNQLLNLINNNGNSTVASYSYDKDGNLAYRSLPGNNTSSTFTNDVVDRVINISHALNGTTRTFAYGYDSVGNRLWTKRDGGNGDVFGYDLNEQATSILMNVPNPDTTAAGSQTISYDADGNRTTFAPYGSTDTYSTNNLNQYTNRNSSAASYDLKGNLAGAFDNSSYIYDAQNRLITATKSGTTENFKYDGLSRQVYRTVGASQPVYNVYDGWDLIGEYAPGSNTPTNAYLSGSNGLVKNLVTNKYYYQDALGSTSHLADSSGALLEWYRYDLQGTPSFYDPTHPNGKPATNFGVRQLFTGEQWYSELGIYDLRCRAYSPDIGRFLQPDPISFYGDATNLYRYCNNNPIGWADPTGLLDLGELRWPLDRTGLGTPGSPFGGTPGNNIELSNIGEALSGEGNLSGIGDRAGAYGGDTPEALEFGSPVPANPFEGKTSVALYIADLIHTTADFTIANGSIGSNGVYYASRWGGNQYVSTLKLAAPIKAAGATLFAASIAIDAYRVQQGTISLTHGSVNTVFGLAAFAGPPGIAISVAYGSIEAFNPGGVPQFLSDYGEMMIETGQVPASGP